MASRFKRIVTRTNTPDSGAPEHAREHVDSELLLRRVRSGLSALEETQDELNRREQELLASASALYEQLRITANELAVVRRQQASASERIDKLRAADHVLDGRQTAAQSADRSEPPRSEALAVQP